MVSITGLARETNEEYVAVKATLLHVRAKSVLLEVQGISAWIPRSLIYGPDEIGLDNVPFNSEIAIRLFEWKAKACGFLP